MKSSVLPDHPAFLRLSTEERTRLSNFGEVWEAPQGSLLYHPGDSGEDVLLVLEGRLECTAGDGGIRRWLPGDLWGDDRLLRPRPVEYGLKAASDSRWMRWSRQSLVDLLGADPSIRRHLSPVRNKDGNLLSGFQEIMPLDNGEKSVDAGFRPSLRPAIPALLPTGLAAYGLYLAASAQESVPAEAPWAAVAAYAGWFLVFFIKRWMTDYGFDADALTSRVFDWSGFSIESRHVPMDRVQGVAVERSGLYRRILGIGTLIIKTSALAGELVFRDVNRPDHLRREIQGLMEAASRRNLGRDRESIRRTLERTGIARDVPTMVRPSVEGSGGPSVTTKQGDVRFRKSPVVLLGRLILPALLTAALIVGAGLIAKTFSIQASWIRLAAILPLLWALFRLEDWRNDSFGISGAYAVDLYRKPLGIKESRRQVELSSIQNIRTEQNGLLPFLFRYGNVILVTAGGASDTVFANVARPWRVQSALFRHREDDMRRREETERASRKDEMTRFAEALDQMRRPTDET